MTFKKNKEGGLEPQRKALLSNLTVESSQLQALQAALPADMAEDDSPEPTLNRV